MDDERWLLPEGIEEILPPTAWQLERLRRRLLDLYHCWGYELVIPPLIEFLESLLIGTDSDLDLQTFKVTDQLSGRTLGIRADMTPQAARIDSHLLRRDFPSRLCYLGTVLRTRSDGFGGSRSPLQVGAELYGHRGFESDAEIISLMLETLRIAGLEDIQLDLGHVAVFRSLARAMELNPRQETWLFEILQRKSLPDLQEQAPGRGLGAETIAVFRDLMDMHGPVQSVLGEAGERFCQHPEVIAALSTLHALVNHLAARFTRLPVMVDLAELRGYHYHTGVVFSCYARNHGQAIAQGGRYDEIGQVFGRARSATGFSADLRTLLLLGKALGTSHAEQMGNIFAPWSTDPALDTLITELRYHQERVVQALPGTHPSPEDLGCTRQLLRRDGVWQVLPVPTAGDPSVD